MEPQNAEEFNEELETGAHENAVIILEDVTAEKIEKEKNELLSRLVANNIVYMKDRVAFILNHFTDTRNSDVDLAWTYWKTYQSERFDGDHITRDQMMKLTRLSSLARERARIQNQYKLFQADPEVRRQRWNREGEFKQAAIDDKAGGNAFYHVFIDESGKTQDYLMVGSLWILKHSGYADYLKSVQIDNWRKENQINSEFHFKRVNNSTLPEYKKFFEMFLSLFPEVGFKLITVNNKGIANQGEAIVDMTYHLLDKGIRHENDTGRAPLPRRLLVSLDEEEKGSDKLKLENIKERLTRQKIDGLRLGMFEAIPSNVNHFIQIADLFTAAVNRKLNTPNTNNAKDELADHILELVGLDISKIDRENSDTDQSHVFNLMDEPPKPTVEGLTTV